ncbi:MAG: prolipoprotein diacylglyceryl transferase family protein [Bacteroidota bacterium]
MYPDLSYLLHALIGTEPDNWTSIIKTFGLMLVLAILAGAFLLERELRRREEAGLLQPVKAKVMVGEPASPLQIVLNAALGFFLFSKFAYAAAHFSDFQIDPASVILSMKGNPVVGLLGALLFGGLKYWEKQQEVLAKPKEQTILIYPHDRIGDITILCALTGVIGAKIFAMVEDIDLVVSGELSLSQFLSQFFSGSGMAIYGGLILPFIIVPFYLRRHKIDTLQLMDAVAPALFIAYGIGRMGCQLSGDGDWGIPIEQFAANGDLIYSYTKPSWLPEWFWAQDYAHNVLNEGIPIEGCEWRYCRKLETPVFPTSVYEIIMSFGLAGLLYSLRSRFSVPGTLFFFYLVLNGLERFWIEKIRVNERYDILGMQSTQAEFIAVILMLIGAAGWIYLSRRHKQQATSS